MRLATRRAVPGWLRGVWLGAALVLLVVGGIGAGATIRAGLGAGPALIEGLKAFILGGAGVALLSAFGLLAFGALPSALTAAEFLAAAWMFGALAFLNTWDWPIYLSLLLGVLAWAGRSERVSVVAARVASTAVGLLAAGVIFFLPWYPSFSSQAGGVLPNLPFPSRLPHFLIMFGTSFLPLLAWMLWRAAPRRKDWRALVAIGLGVPAALLVISWFVAGLAVALRPDLIAAATDSFGAPDSQTAISAILARRLTSSWTALVLGLLLASAALLLRRHAKDVPQALQGSPWAFVALLAIVGALLVMGPEFLYLKDLFMVRMNTVFKFYFAAWILWGLAGAYVISELWPRQWSWGGALRAGSCLVVVLGLVYTVTATWSKTEGFRPANGRTLDGTAHLSWENPSDYVAILWMNANLTPGVVAEAVGGSYSYGGRISVHTGFPTVIGWPWHEVQWRGDARFLGTREVDIRRLYQSRDWVEADAIITQYEIDYVYVGGFERDTYGAIQESMFAAFMDTVYVGDGVTIYAVRDTG
jgi:YYY domain-containing protein